MVQGELIMDIVEIYKDGTQFMWPNNKTFLCVFDENDNLVTDYDLCSGLKLMQKDNEIINSGAVVWFKLDPEPTLGFSSI